MVDPLHQLHQANGLWRCKNQVVLFTQAAAGQKEIVQQQVALGLWRQVAEIQDQGSPHKQHFHKALLFVFGAAQELSARTAAKEVPILQLVQGIANKPACAQANSPGTMERSNNWWAAAKEE